MESNRAERKEWTDGMTGDPEHHRVAWARYGGCFDSSW